MPMAAHKSRHTCAFTIYITAISNKPAFKAKICPWLFEYHLRSPHITGTAMFNMFTSHQSCQAILTIFKQTKNVVHTVYGVCHEKTDLKVFVGVIPKEGWMHVAAPILLWV